MIRIITFAVAIALLPGVSATAVANNRACAAQLAATKRPVGPSEFTKFVSACGHARNFRGSRKEAAQKWADCVNRRVDKEQPDSTDEWQKIMTACLLAGR
jgi:hypothetical protein